MKNLFLLIIACFFLFALQACQKCQTCRFTYTDTNGQTVTSDVGESCGDDVQLSALQAECEASAQVVNGDCTCSAQ